MSFSKRLPNSIIIKAQQGDKFAITQIYQEYKSAIFGLSFRILQDRDAAEDILQQVIERMMQKMNTLNEPSKFNGWLKTLTYRASIDYVNKSAKELGADILEELVTDDSGYAEATLDIDKYLAILNQRERLIVVLFLVEGLSHREVAEKLAISEVNSKQIYRRSLNKLKQLAAKESYGGAMQGNG